MKSIDTEQFLSCFFNPEEKVCIRVLSDRKKDETFSKKYTVILKDYKLIEEVLYHHNANNRGVFFAVNYGGHDDKSITRINAQFMECDNSSFDEQIEKIKEFPLTPSVIIKTAKSLHTYWLVKDGKVDRFRQIQKLLAEYFDGDKLCVNESRVMRLPGFNHCKGDPVEVKCVFFHPENIYTQDEIESVLTKRIKIEDETEHINGGDEKGLELVIAKCDFIKHCIRDAATLSEFDWFAMISNLVEFDGGINAIHSFSKDYPEYSFNETCKKINHVIGSKIHPITCAKIAENGFKCAKMDTNACKGRSPAALCFNPLDIKTLSALVERLVVKTKLTDDISTAADFIRKYLFNSDGATAYSVIYGSIKTHFRFDKETLKSLENMYKETSKAYKTGLKSKKAKMESNLPAWYEMTEKGVRFMPGILADYLADNTDIIYAGEDYYRYQNGVYVVVTEKEIQRICREKMISRDTRMNQIKDAESQFRLNVIKDINEINPDPYIINLKNGFYHVLENKLSEHTPEYISTIQLPVNYVEGADCPQFRKFLYESFDGDESQVNLIKEMMGYFLIPVNNAQKCFVIVGAAAAGKSVLLNVINNILLGKENVSNVSLQSLNERFKPAELFGKLANIFADLPTKSIDDTGIFKALVGGDSITVEKKNKNPFSFSATARLLFSCNRIPKNYADNSEGFFRRLVIIRFLFSIPAEKRDPNLLEKFKDEADGIFQFAIEGLRQLIKNDFVFSVTSVNEEELEKYREDSNSVLCFAKEVCEFDNSFECGSTELYDKYKVFCEDSGFMPFALRTFITNLLLVNTSVSRGKDKTGRRRILKGVRVKDE